MGPGVRGAGSAAVPAQPSSARPRVSWTGARTCHGHCLHTYLSYRCGGAAESPLIHEPSYTQCTPPTGEDTLGLAGVCPTQRRAGADPASSRPLPSTRAVPSRTGLEPRLGGAAAQGGLCFFLRVH